MFTSFRLRIREFYRNNKRKVIIILIFWTIIFAINTLLKVFKVDKPKNTYKPHTSVMDSSSTVPGNLQEPIITLIDNFINSCNEKNYEKAYTMLEKGCKEESFQDLETFKKYVDVIFDSQKIYNVQNYSNKNNTYIYNVRILNDILATGINNKDDDKYYEEKMIIKNTDKGLTLSVKEYIETKTIDAMYEDENVKIQIEKAIINYETEKYFMKITNKTDYMLVAVDNTEGSNGLFLNLDSKMRDMKNYGVQIAVLPNKSKEFTIEFTKFFDDGTNAVGIKFNNLRLFESYPFDITKRSEVLKNPLDAYSFEIKF